MAAAPGRRQRAASWTSRRRLRLALALTAAVAGSFSADARSEREEVKHRRADRHQYASIRSSADVPTIEGLRISVIVATRDRPEMLKRCVASILANAHDDFELIVVDQSEVQAALPADSRVRHMSTRTTGKTAALNLGVRAARGAILAFTDDDCTAPPGWLAHAESLFLEHPELELAFGALVPIDHDPTMHFVPATHFKTDTSQIVRGKSFAYIKGGAGANLIARRRLFDVIGPWDELIGPGSRFKACEEWDIYYRALAGGATVALVPELSMLHWGIRSRSDGQALAWGYAYGEGAVIGKHLRLGDLGMVMPALRILLDEVLASPRRVWDGQRPGFRSMLWRCRGILAGARNQVDPNRRLFLD